MEKTSDKGMNLKQAIDHYGSLQNALENHELKKKALEEEIKKRRVRNQKLKQEKVKLNSHIKRLNRKYLSEQSKLESLEEKADKWARQYDLLQSLLAMLVTSPSVNSSLKSLIALLEEPVNSGWELTKTPDDMRSLFVSMIMGDYLKSFRCKSCGGSFMTNKDPYYKHTANWYQCPSCHTNYGVEADDTFIKAMVSEEKLDNIIKAGELKKENDILKPLKPFLSLACEVCGKPITEWNEDNVNIAIEYRLWGHTNCWNGGVGQLKLLLKISKDMAEKQ